jgi:hypothetical protein
MRWLVGVIVGVFAAVAVAEPVDPVRSVREAANPSSAEEAYARAKGGSVDRGPADRVALDEAFVRRMAELGVPEKAEAQARELLRERPGDGAAVAVVALADAGRGEMAAALEGIRAAVRTSADDWFVQRAAAQVLARYDRDEDARAKAAPAVREAVAEVARAMVSKSEFAGAYQKAYGAPAAPREIGPAERVRVSTGREAWPPVPVEPDPGSVGGYVMPQAVYGYEDYNGRYYSDPYLSAYSGYGWGPSAWWGSGVVIVDRPFYGRGIYGGGFGHGRFDRGRVDGRRGRMGYDRGPIFRPDYGPNGFVGRDGIRGIDFGPGGAGRLDAGRSRVGGARAGGRGFGGGDVRGARR